jgi:hypothetical protein
MGLFLSRGMIFAMGPREELICNCLFDLEDFHILPLFQEAIYISVSNSLAQAGQLLNQCLSRLLAFKGFH